MQSFASVILEGGRATLRHWRVLLPLYIAGLLLGLLQTWPVLLAAARGQLNTPYIGTLAGGGTDAAAGLFLSNPSAVGAAAGLWALGALALTLLFGGLYNFFSGGIIQAYLGGSARTFWGACRRTFWPFAGVGLLLIVLAIPLLGIAVATGGALGQRAALILGFVLVQLLNLLGEYARALAVANDRRNPFVLLWQAIGFCARHPAGTLGLAGLGLALHAGLALLYTTTASAIGGAPLAIGWQQLAVLAWLWVKLLRLAWAAAYVRLAAGDLPPVAQANIYGALRPQAPD
jgi:hypothetical protein